MIYDEPGGYKACHCCLPYYNPGCCRWCNQKYTVKYQTDTNEWKYSETFGKMPEDILQEKLDEIKKLIAELKR